jgi:endonuclease/exonuclease/phosphatase family metal-dependent hydrolase
LRKAGYGIVHYDSPDRRGIDVALFYRKSVFRLVGTSLQVPSYEGKPLATRHMLQVSLDRMKDGEEMSFIVCHHPSKYGGAELSQGRRFAAMETLRQMCDSLHSGYVVVMGDFNDVPSAPQFEKIDGILYNKADDLHERHKGTIRYRGKWELIDMFMVGESLSERSRMDIVRVPFLMTEDARYSGEKPLRTYSGPRYLGGVSDHCPVVLELW